ncbi:MAG: hypothetical protein ACREBC_38680, partial [Pyrinomonadaceae bacterium]
RSEHSANGGRNGECGGKMIWRPITEKPKREGWYLLWFDDYSLWREAYYTPDQVNEEWSGSSTTATHWCDVEPPEYLKEKA